MVLGSLLYTAGSAILYVLPAYLGELSAQRGLGEAQMGSISAAENIGIALASLSGMFWLTRVDRRLLAGAGRGVLRAVQSRRLREPQLQLAAGDAVPGGSAR